MNISTEKVHKSLNEIALKHRTDKSSEHHNYTAIYEKYFEPTRNDKIALLELGIGGYEYPDKGGNSARMWRDYFPNAEITAIDAHPKNFIIHGVRFIQISQDDPSLPGLVSSFDIIIDDASHINPLTIKSFENLWHKVRPGGVYIIEDTHTSYWGVASDGVDFGGGDHENTVINYFKRKCDELYVETGIDSIHFYKQMIFIFKKK